MAVGGVSEGLSREASILESGKERLVFKYDSPNHLCGVLRFVAQGVLAYYGEPGSVSKRNERSKARPGAKSRFDSQCPETAMDDCDD